MEFLRLAIIGNAGGGKTTLGRKLAKIHGFGLHHVDTFQFISGMKIRAHSETIQILNEIQAQKSWIIDGYGPLDIIENRFEMADRIIFIDFPLWRHYWWVTKRQIKSFWSPRLELPAECDELTLAHTIKLYKTIWRMHQKMRPELLRILNRENNKRKLIWVRTYAEWTALFKNGIQDKSS